MLTRSQILNLVPHRGASFLIDQVVSLSPAAIVCEARSHLDPSNPLRRDGRLETICGAEYGLQAAALHGALEGGRPQEPGYLASLRAVQVAAPRLDDPTFGTLRIEADLESGDEAGMIYTFRLLREAGALLLQGRATVVFPQDLRDGLPPHDRIGTPDLATSSKA